jgi:hypothetical protein
MALLYTTTDAIARRLRGRLQVGGLDLPFQPTNVDDDLIAQIGDQVEAKVNARLRAVYKVPLSGQHPILAGIVEKLTCGEILATHMMGEEQITTGGNPSDRSYAGFLIRDAQKDLDAIASGDIPLDGETLATGDEAANSNARNVTLARKRTPGTAEGVVW